ncbi:hypothetical protein D9M68_700560 [compost metagenome]
MTSARPVTAASGKPPARLLAMVMRSGATSWWSMANILPVRAKPVWTSSAIRRMPCWSQISRSAFMKAAGAG